MNEPNMHTLSARLTKRDEKIKELQAEIALLKIGGQPASKVRDLVLPALKQLKSSIDETRFFSLNVVPLRMFDELIAALGENIPGAVEYKPAPPSAREAGLKPYVPLDHGPRDNAAAAPEYRVETYIGERLG